MLEVDPCPVSEGSYAACLRAVAHRLIMPSCLERGGLTVPAGDRPRSWLSFQDAWDRLGLYWLPGQQPDENLGVDITQAQVRVLNQLPYPVVVPTHQPGQPPQLDPVAPFGNSILEVGVHEGSYSPRPHPSRLVAGQTSVRLASGSSRGRLPIRLT